MSDIVEEPITLTPSLKSGVLVHWRTLDGKEHIGRLKEYDNGTAIVVLPDGKEKAIRCDRWGA